MAYSKHFQCDCERCCDPTELGTYLSALKCMKCSVGYYLAQDPLSESSAWKCEACGSLAPSTLGLFLSVVYRKLKYLAETEYFHYSAFGFGRRNFILDIRPSVLS